MLAFLSCNRISCNGLSRIIPWAGVVLAVSPFLVNFDHVLAQTSSTKQAKEIQSLIIQLGDDEYHTREAAEQKLLQFGHDAFDLLKANDDHEDLEISSRVNYILQQLRIDWLREDDPEEVRQLLARYSELPESERGERIGRLALLSKGRGAVALARIARFDSSPILAREAALRLAGLATKAIAEAAPKIQRECGSSQRPPVDWVRASLVEAKTPKSAVALWAQAVEKEMSRLEREGLSQDPDRQDIVFSLLEHELGLCNRLDLVDETTASLVRQIRVSQWVVIEGRRGRKTQGLIQALIWIVENERWQVLEQIEARYEKDIRKERKLVYYLAAAYDKQGLQKIAEETALRAFELIADDDEQRARLGNHLLKSFGKLAWAEREWQYVVDGFAVVDKNALKARRYLADWHHDRGEDREAAELLAATCDALDENPPAKANLKKALAADYYYYEPLEANYARRHLYQALHYRTLGDVENEAKQLTLAVSAYEDDPDVLIAMYHAKSQDEEFRKRTDTTIRRASRRLLAQIGDNPDAAGLYNYWAWLISNTEGDFQKAIAFSKKSLEYSPGEPQFLDTLAHCYFAAGEYEKAVKCQRQAVDKLPYYQAMRTKLEEFEAALEQQKASGESNTPPRSTPRESDAEAEQPKKPSEPQSQKAREKAEQIRDKRSRDRDPSLEKK